MTLTIGHLADDLTTPVTLPDDAQTTMTAIIGRRGSGKTTTASVILEELAAARLPTVVLDPLGVWWGLRSAADGESAGLPVTILGGQHGDLPLDDRAGTVIADLIIEQPGLYVLDLSGFESRAAERRFATDFAVRIYRGKAERREALAVIVDEADTFAPQRPADGEQALLGAFEAIARRGRVRGLGMVLITQRPAVLNKNLLSQCELIIAHQLTAPQDRDALKAWAQGNATADQVEQFIGSLASLRTGQAWLWSPAWLDVFARLQVRPRWTFDSSATPKAGEARVEPRVLAPVDLDALRDRMAETIERVEADDPKKLRAEITRLHSELSKVARNIPTNNPCDHEAELEGLRTLVAGQSREISDVRRQLVAAEEVVGDYQVQLGVLHQEILGLPGLMEREALRITGRTDNPPRRVMLGSHNSASDEAEKQEPPAPAALAPTKTGGVVRASVEPKSRPSSVPAGAGNTAVTGPEQRILDALAWWESIGVTAPENSAVAFIAEYSPTSTSYTNPRGALRTKGLIEYPAGGFVSLTEMGRAAANALREPPSRRELHGRILARLSGPEQRLLQPLLDCHPDDMTNAELAEDAGYSATSTSYTNPRGHLRSLGLIDYPSPGRVVATALLFPEGVPA